MTTLSMKLKAEHLLSLWIVLFLLVLAGVLIFHTSTDSFAKGDFGGVQIAIEYAQTPEEREQGLSGRSEVPDNYGMLFVFEEPGEYAFWMKDMLIPIDIFWLDAEYRVISIKENALPEKYPESYSPRAPALYVLETRAGFAAEHAITVGTTLSVQDFSFAD
jgi:uncharacterized protein